MTVITRYIDDCPLRHQPYLLEVYHLLKDILPEAEEKIGYGMPTFYLGQNIIHFSDNRNHLGLYPTPSGVSAFSDELTGFKTSKGAIQLPYDQPLPLALIKKIAEFRKKEVLG